MINMKRIIILLIILFFFAVSFSQKNEISFLFGKAIKAEDVLQINYQRVLYKSFCVQVSFRYHNEVVTAEYISPYNNVSEYIEQSFTSKKINITPVLIPINRNHFKLKTGLGFDVGYSLYTWALNIRYYEHNTPDGMVEDAYFKYDNEYLIDYGIHYFLATSYYLNNSLFFTGQCMLNQVFNEQYSVAILRRSGIYLSLGVGYQF